MKKGLRRRPSAMSKFVFGADLCPDEEGIKTRAARAGGPCVDARTSALMKKGLRPGQVFIYSMSDGADLCPDEEGIKTDVPGLEEADDERGPLP